MGDIIKKEMTQLLEDVEQTQKEADDLGEKIRISREELVSLGIFKEE